MSHHRPPIFYGGSSNSGDGLNDSVLASVLSDISSSVSSITGTSQISITTSTDSNFGLQTLMNVSPTDSTTNFPTNLKIKLPASVENLSNFTYIIYPSSYGNLTSAVKNTSIEEIGSFNRLGTANHERYSSVNTEYVVYRSGGQNAFQENDTLTLND